MTFEIGEEVIWRRSKSDWSRTGSERVRAVVEGVTPRGYRLRLLSNIRNRLTALVRRDRVEKA